MTIDRLTTLALFVAVSVVPAAAEKATFIKKPKVLGSEISTITTFSSHQHITCRGRCSKGAAWDYWQCKGTSLTVRCELICSPVPRPGCQGI
jgi:hypothetical protein